MKRNHAPSRKRTFRKNYSGVAVSATIDQMQSCDILRPLLMSVCVEIVRSIALERPSVFALGLRSSKGNQLYALLFAAACEKNEPTSEPDGTETQDLSS